MTQTGSGSRAALPVGESQTINVMNEEIRNFPSGPVVKNPPANAGDPGSVPGLGRFRVQWGNQAHALQLLKPTRSRALALQQEKPLQ